jgi:murein DD-endopeptidase MepM/ murein hydrolase activator NlpD
MAKDRALIRDIERGTYILERGASGATIKLEPGETVPTFPRRKFVPPVGLDEFANNPQIWPGHWIDATGYCQHYAYGWHTGADLNLNHPHWDADRHAPVYAISDGEVYAVRTNVSGWHTVICIRHPASDGFTGCLSRYAHVENIQVRQGETVHAGQHIANIGNAGGRYPYHVHVDTTRLDARMAQYPLDWPGNAKDRVLRDYLDPASFLYALVGGQ